MQHTSACSAKVPGVSLLRACRAPKWQCGKHQHRHKGQALLLATAISTREVTETTTEFESFFNSLASDLTSEQSTIPAGYFEILESVNALRPEFANLQEQELAVVSEELRSRYDAGSTLDELLPEAFALVREATYRKLGKAHYDVQLMGGIVLHRGSIAEMATGEGKSLTGILPAYLYGLSGGCVCMVTVNDYLAKRDAQLFHTVFQLLGMEVQYAPNSMSHQERKDVYESADIVYVTAYTLAFDYLHDTKAIDASHLALPTLGFAVIDEVDQILIDNAMMPFILADPASFWNEALQERIRQACAVASGIVYKELSLTAGMQDTPQNAAKVAMLKGVLQGVPGDISQALEQQVILGAHQEIALFAYKNGLNHQSHKLSLFNQNWTQQNVEVSAIGSLYAKHKVMSMFGVDEEAWRKHKWPGLIQSALIAFLLHRRDVDYTIAPDPQTGKRSVILIDKATNRLLPSTKLQNVMHEFVTAKHEIEMDRPTISQSKITYAKLFERFQKVAGMTGTAKESANAFWECYKLSVLVVPPNKPCIRKDHPRQLHITDAEALQEADYIIKGAWVSGRPLLIGTASTSASERIYNHVTETLEKERRAMEETINYNARQGKHGDDVNAYRRLLHKLENVHIALLNSDESLVQQESMIVAQAGMFGHVTVATNMAGRGTDILLGGNPAQLCGLLLAQQYNQHFVNLYVESSQTANSSNGSEEGLAAMEAVAWRNSFDPITNVTARRLLTEWKQRIQQSQRSGGLLHSRFQLVFEAIIESHMTPNTPNAWDAKQYTEWMKRLQEVVLPLMLYVERRLPEVSNLRLDADQNPPYLTDLDQNANDPLLQRIPVYEISDDPDTPTALISAVLRAVSNGKTSIEGSDVICAVCAAAVEDALEKETLVLDKDMPADAVTYALVAHAWLAWFSAQQRKLIMLGGTYTAENAAQVVANGGEWEQGGLIVLQWGAANNVRVERQLRGRAGRQGDPGESHVVISLEDPTMYALQESFKVQESFLSLWSGSLASEILTSKLPSQLAKEYRMRVQNEDAVLFADVKRDVSLDRWRTMHERLRMSVLHADRSMLLAAYCGMFRQLISELLQAPRVRVQRGRWGFGRVPTGDVVTADKAGGEGLGPAIDCRLHPRTWDLQAIAQLMDEIVNSYYENSEDSMGIITFQVISEVNAVILQEFLDKGHGTLPHPGSEVSSLDLWYACNLESSSKAQQPSVPAALVDALLGGRERLWEGRFASQAQMLTKYLAQLLLTRLVQKEKLNMTHAVFRSTHLRMPILKALDHAWQCVIIEEHAIQTSQGLDSLAALDPEAEYKARVADSFTMHYRKVAEAASRNIFGDLNEETSSKPQWVAVQKARYRTPADAAGDDEDASGSE